MTNPGSILQNHLLNAPPAHNYYFLSPLLRIIQLSFEKVLYESGEALRYVDLPTTCIVSMNFMAEQGTSTKVAMIDNEGMIGIILFMDSEATTNLAIMLTQGYAYRLLAELFKQEFNHIGGHQRGALQHALPCHTLGWR